MDTGLYLKLSALMFMEFAVWGAWMPVLAIRLLGPLKMSGKQTGWIYATFPLACIFAPLASGYLADKHFNAEHIMLVAHAIGAVLLFIAAKQTKFWPLLITMFAYSICYTATLPLVNKMVNIYFPADVSEKAWVQPWVFLWAPVAWALIGYLLTGIRQLRKIGGDGPDSLYLASLLSIVMVVVCLIQPDTLPEPKGNPMKDAVDMLRNNSDYLLFMLVQLAVSGMMQFYFLGTGQFLQDRGMIGRNVSAAMGIAQAVQAAATMLLLGVFMEHLGFRWTFAIGALCWSVLFAVYALSRHVSWVVAIQAFHGLAYVFFIIAGQIFVNTVAPKVINASAQSLIFIATNGIGLFLGTQLAGYVMERNNVGGKLQWPKIWTVPLAITLAGAIVLALFFTVPEAADFKSIEKAPDKAAAGVDSATPT